MIETRREPTFDAALGAPEPAPPPRAPRRSLTPLAIAAAVVVAGGAAWWWFTQREAAVAPPPPVATQAVPAPAAAASAPEQILSPAAENEHVPAAGIVSALTELLGADAMRRFIETTDFPRRAVATLDALGREHAPIAAWPVLPTPGRFEVQQAGGTVTAAPANAARYAPFVAFVGAIDVARAVDLYRRMYPELQQAYRSLGFGERMLNDRVLRVIDILLGTPDPASPPQLVLTEVKGPIAPDRPWTRYEYADPMLQQLSAGQKILLRMAPQQRQVLKAKLRELRAEILRVSQPRP